jgi:hypothetical protein
MALDQYALTTLSHLKTYLGIVGSSEDSPLERTINNASARIESFLDRKIMARDYVEFHDGDWNRSILMRNYPTNHVRYVGCGRDNAFTVSVNVPATWATCSVTLGETSFRVYQMTTAGTETSTTINLATYKTASTLVAQINALALGITATLVSDCPSKYLHRCGPIDLTDDMAEITYANKRAANTRIDLYRGIVVLPKWQDPEWEDEGDDEGQTFGKSRQTVVIDYNAGYTTIPYDIEQACLEISKLQWFGRRRDESLNSESLGDYSYTSGGAAILNEIIEERLSSWRDIR